MIDRKGNEALVQAINELTAEKGINKEAVYTGIEEALRNGYKNNFNRQSGMPANTNVRVEIDRKTGAIRLFARKTVVDEVYDSVTEISLEEARRIQPSYEVDDIVEVEIEPGTFRRIAAQTAKQVILQKIREAERGKVFENLSEKENEILTAIVYNTDAETGVVSVELGKTEGFIDPSQQMATDVYRPGERMKVYVISMISGGQYVSQQNKKGPAVSVSRTHSGLVKRLFELEVPEIQEGLVQIRSIAREAGSRTKIAVYSTDPMVDPVGSCVGPRGQRVDRIVTELRGEKIDIIKWSSDPAEFVANSLNPANVLEAHVEEREKLCSVVVPDNQLSLAIGKEGQNARLAARLTGWKIDIKSQTQANELREQERARELAQEEPGE